MNVKHTIVALVIVAVLGGALYFLYRVPEKPSKDAVPKENLFSFKPEDVEEFTLTAGSQPPATIRRAAAGAPASKPDAVKPETAKTDDKKDVAPQWQVTQPEDVAADSTSIQTFVEEVASMQM